METTTNPPKAIAKWRANPGDKPDPTPSRYQDRLTTIRKLPPRHRLPRGSFSTATVDGKRLEHDLAVFITSLPGNDWKYNNDPSMNAMVNAGYTQVRRDLNPRDKWARLMKTNAIVSDFNKGDPDAKFAYVDTRQTKMAALRMQMYGDVSRVSCTECQCNGGHWKECIVMSGVDTMFNGACANCQFSGHQGRCDFATKAAIVAARRAQRQKERDAAAREIAKKIELLHDDDANSTSEDEPLQDAASDNVSQQTVKRERSEEQVNSPHEGTVQPAADDQDSQHQAIEGAIRLRTRSSETRTVIDLTGDTKRRKVVEEQPEPSSQAQPYVPTDLMKDWRRQSDQVDLAISSLKLKFRDADMLDELMNADLAWSSLKVVSKQLFDQVEAARR